MGSGYFYTARAAIQYHPQWESAAALYSKAAMYSDAINNALTGHSENTFLMPDQKALKPVAEALVNAPAADLTKVIEYHVLPGECCSDSEGNCQSIYTDAYPQQKHRRPAADRTHAQTPAKPLAPHLHPLSKS